MTPVLHAEGLRKTYQSFVALEGLDLSIPEGSIYGLLGPNGAGKTTFLRMVNQIIAPDSGHLRFQGLEMTPAHARQIGYLPEERGLYKKMKVGEQALYLAQLKGMDPKVAKAKLKKIGLYAGNCRAGGTRKWRNSPRARPKRFNSSRPSCTNPKCHFLTSPLAV